MAVGSGESALDGTDEPAEGEGEGDSAGVVEGPAEGTPPLTLLPEPLWTGVVLETGLALTDALGAEPEAGTVGELDAEGTGEDA